MASYASIADELRNVRSQLRAAYFAMRIIRIRQAARSAFDLTGFGPNWLARLCSAMIVAFVFAAAGLVASWCGSLRPAVAVIVGGIGFVAVMATCGVMVAGPADDELAARGDATIDKIEQLERQESALGHQVANVPAPPRSCPYCGGDIPDDAAKCRHCGEYLSARLRAKRQQQSNTGAAAVLSFFVPGLGQAIKGQWISGLCWFVMAAVTYPLCCAGFIVHVICVFDAASSN